MITQERIPTVFDRPVYDTEGNKIGDAKHVFLGDAAGRPERAWSAPVSRSCTAAQAARTTKEEASDQAGQVTEEARQSGKQVADEARRQPPDAM